MRAAPGADGIDYRVRPPVTNEELHPLFASAWPGHTTFDFTPVLRHSLAWVCAYAGERLVGYVNLAWDGAQHAFILDTTVHADFQRRGIGRRLVELAAAEATANGVDWVHVDYEPHLHEFYRQCGFHPTLAGLLRVGGDRPHAESE
jgi:GNAT superfamily N-acetyltransferase